MEDETGTGVQAEGWAEKSLLVHGVGVGHPAGGSVLAVVAVLQVNLGLSNKVISPHQVPIVDGHCQHGLHGEGGLNVEGSRAGRVGEGKEKSC